MRCLLVAAAGLLSGAPVPGWVGVQFDVDPQQSSGLGESVERTAEDEVGVAEVPDTRFDDEVELGEELRPSLPMRRFGSGRPNAWRTRVLPGSCTRYLDVGGARRVRRGR
jgi:hypothetical protein